MNEKIVYSLAERVQEKFNPEKIIVFGSWARGEAGPDIDEKGWCFMNAEERNRIILE
ncbi:nucleotidyltransferase domain-containing protein [Moorella naiadis]|uniref:nucleotidyltransferase domain-containing protein n=1 Tax=Moorella naiadis (nom. illeg.) TaxID=3093670 RepID=UPI003D9C9D71